MCILDSMLKPSNILSSGLTEFFCKNFKVKEKPLSVGSQSGKKELLFPGKLSFVLCVSLKEMMHMVIRTIIWNKLCVKFNIAKVNIQITLNIKMNMYIVIV